MNSEAVIEIGPDRPRMRAAAGDAPIFDRRSSALLITAPTSAEAEAIRALRTRIVAQHVREGRRALVICSPSADTGCTFVASNLAIAFAQIGTRTALLDADLRQPGIGRLFDLPPDMSGLSEYLSQPDARADEIAMTEVMPNLSVIAAGRPTPNPQELLSTDRFHDLIDQLLREFELTIFDTSPANICTDGQRVATVAGYSLIVARKHRTYMSDVMTLARTLRADRSVVVGTVLNDF